MALIDRRLEMMRQLTKVVKKSPYIADREQSGEVYLLIDVMTQECFGVFSSEDLAWHVQSGIWETYSIETEVKVMALDDQDIISRVS